MPTKKDPPIQPCRRGRKESDGTCSHRSKKNMCEKDKAGHPCKMIK